MNYGATPVIALLWPLPPLLGLSTASAFGFRHRVPGVALRPSQWLMASKKVGAGKATDQFAAAQRRESAFSGFAIEKIGKARRALRGRPEVNEAVAGLARIALSAPCSLTP